MAPAGIKNQNRPKKLPSRGAGSWARNVYDTGALVLQVQRVIHASESFKVPLTLETQELVLLEDSTLDLLQSSIKSQVSNVFLNYAFESRAKRVSGPSIARGQLFVKRIFNNAQQKTRPLAQSHPIRAELELAEFTRQHFVKNFDQSECPVISVPLLTFIDGFGLYRNMYRSLMGVYLIIAAFTFQERARLEISFDQLAPWPIPLDPFDSIIYC